MNTLRPDEAMSSALSDRAELLLATVEDQWFDRKSVRIGTEAFARSLVGFANAEGGTILVGLSDGQVEDTRGHVERVNRLRQAAHTHTAPPVRVRFEEVSVLDGDGEAAVLLAARVQPGEAMHEMTNGDVFLRMGDSTVKLDRTQREELSYDRGSSHFEARPLAEDVDAVLDPMQVEAYRSAVGAETSEGLLHARSLLTRRDEPTVAAVLLFGRHPQSLLPHAHVRVVRYAGIDRGAGAHQTLVHDGDRRLEGPLTTVIDDVTRLVGEWVPVRRALGADGRFGPLPIVPRDVWLEGVVNAAVHRSYSMSGDHIRIEIFDDRIEIESPGRFPGLVDPSLSLDISRYARNPRLARVCSDLGITQELGEGIRRMVREMRANGLTDPIYRQTSGSVRLTLSGVQRLAPAVAAQLPPGTEEVLRVLRQETRPLGTGEITAAAGFGRPKTIRALEALREAGFVRWHGKSRKDPRATWQAMP